MVYTNLFYKGDCLEYLQNFEKKFNCLITDPPYGISHSSNRRKEKDSLTKRGILNDSNNESLIIKSLSLSYDLLLNNSHVYIFCSWNKVHNFFSYIEPFFKIKNILIWDKGNHGSGDLKGSYGNKYECIIYAVKGKRKLNSINGISRHSDILFYPKVSSKKLLHPHQKPLELLEFLIKKSTNEDEWILDPFAGIGSVGLAARNRQRSSVSIELDETFYNKGMDLLNE